MGWKVKMLPNFEWQTRSANQHAQTRHTSLLTALHVPPKVHSRSPRGQVDRERTIFSGKSFKHVGAAWLFFRPSLRQWAEISPSCNALMRAENKNNTLFRVSKNSNEKERTLWGHLLLAFHFRENYFSLVWLIFWKQKPRYDFSWICCFPLFEYIDLVWLFFSFFKQTKSFF